MFLRAAWPRAEKPLLQAGHNSLAWPWVRYSPPAAQEPSPPPAPVHVQPYNADLSRVPHSFETKGSFPQTGPGVKGFEAAAPVTDPPKPAQGPSDSSAPGRVPLSSVPVAEPVLLEPSVPEPETVLILPDPSAAPLPPPEPIYKPGKVIRKFSIYEHGNQESEFHDIGDLLPPPHPFPGASENSGPEASSLVYPPDVAHDDEFFQMFLNGQLIPGTITHISSTYEHGHNAWTDIGFERIPLPPKQATKGR